MCLIISNLVQPMSNPFRAIGGAYGQKWAFWAKNGRFRVSGDPRCHFLGALKAQTGHPGCVWQCPTLSNQCPTHLKPLEVPMCENGHHCQNLAIFWPKMGQKWWNLMGARLDITLFNQRKKLASLVFPKSKNFLTPPLWTHCVVLMTAMIMMVRFSDTIGDLYDEDGRVTL